MLLATRVPRVLRRSGANFACRSMASTLLEQIKGLGDEIKVKKAAGEGVDELVSRMLQLKELAGIDTGKKKGPTQFVLKTPKGTKDWADRDIVLRERIFRTITDVFRRHGGQSLDTPVFELREILAGKYGEDSKLIYDLQDQGGEICSLRYDLTVPFARWLAMNPTVQQIKRFHLAKVYRRDQPAMNKGRMREFYQCDFDIAGHYDRMMPDAEILRIVVEVFKELEFPAFTIKLNNRKVLDGLFAVCGVPEAKIRTISSAIDKLDKLPWEDVRHEMTVEKGLAPDVADKIGEYVKLRGGLELVNALLADAQLSGNSRAREGLEDMKILYDYLDALQVTDFVVFDMSLARGLDYYTGIIYEVITEGSAPKTKAAPAARTIQDGGDRSDDDTVGVGSVAAGGRYDELVGMFSQSKKPSHLPCVGISFGVERIFSILRARIDEAALRPSEVQVYVMAFGGGKEFDGFAKERMAVCAELWAHGISAEFIYKAKPKSKQQFDAADRTGVPFAVILGQDELANGLVRIKRLGLKEAADEGTTVPRADMVKELLQLIQH